MKNIKEYFPYIFIIALVIGAFLLGQSCSGTKVIEPTKTEYIERWRDSIMPQDTFFSHSVTPGKPVYIHDTITEYLDSTECNRFYVYNDTIKDSKYEVVSKVIVQGKLRHSDIMVKLKVPLIIKDCTVVRRDTFIYRPYENEIHAGLIVGTKMIAPTLEMSVNKHTFGVGYDPFNKQPVVTYKFRLFGWTPKKKK